jgi:hypothetical protein
MNKRLLNADPMLRLAVELGYSITPGRRHWHLTHEITGSRTILPFGRKRSTRSVRNITAHLRRGAKDPLVHPVLKHTPQPSYVQP